VTQRATVSNGQSALALLASRGMMTLSQLVQAVVGVPVKGSWWGHPKGHEIFKIATELGESPDVLVTKMGKVMFMHRMLWPALLRLVADPAWRRRASKGLGAEARKLLRDVEKAGTLRVSGDKDARAELERRGLVLSTSEHAERGHHVAVMVSWQSWAKPELMAEARAMDAAQAVARLRTAGLRWE
jgi:hypothetical protein